MIIEWSSGLIVDTPSSFAAGLPGASTDKKYSLVKACVDSFQSESLPELQSCTHCSEDCTTIVNVILVVGHEKLNVEMQRMFGSQLSVIKLPKSGGVRIPIHNVPPFFSLLALSNKILLTYTHD